MVTVPVVCQRVLLMCCDNSHRLSDCQSFSCSGVTERKGNLNSGSPYHLNSAIDDQLGFKETVPICFKLLNDALVQMS